MKKEEFCEKLVEGMMERLGEGFDVVLREVVKNNHVVLKGLVINNKSNNISPTIYIDVFWDAYCEGVSYDSIIERLMQIYERDTPRKNLDMSFFTDFERVKDGICYELINAKENEELLNSIPHVLFLDLAFCFYYAYNCKDFGDGTIRINNSHADMWHTSSGQLMELAEKNTPRLFPWECVSMENILAELSGADMSNSCTDVENGSDIMDEMNLFLEKTPLHVLSNIKKIHGAVSFLYPGVMEELSKSFGCSFYILPSSIHEVILLARGEMDNEDELREMIRVINETQVEPEEVLSNSLYCFDSASGEIMVI